MYDTSNLFQNNTNIFDIWFYQGGIGNCLFEVSGIGLNSNTFNYLETNSGPLDVGRDILPVDFSEWNEIKFFSQCQILDR